MGISQNPKKLTIKHLYLRYAWSKFSEIFTHHEKNIHEYSGFFSLPHTSIFPLFYWWNCHNTHRKVFLPAIPLHTSYLLYQCDVRPVRAREGPPRKGWSGLRWAKFESTHKDPKRFKWLIIYKWKWEILIKVWDRF